MSISTANKVCIILATYNPNLVFFRKQIESIRTQKYNNWNCLICDDGSTEEFVRGLMDVISSDSRFQFIRSTTNQGSFNNFGLGLSEIFNSVGQNYVALCDQDDIWESNKLEVLVQILDQHPEVSLVHSDLSLIDAEDQQKTTSCWKMESRNISVISRTSLIYRNVVTGCSVLFRMEVLKSALPFQKLPFPPPYHHDVWLALHALAYGKIYSIKAPLIRYRQHSANVVGAQVASRDSYSLLKKINSWSEFRLKTTRAYFQRAQLAQDFLKSKAVLESDSTLKTSTPDLDSWLPPLTWGKFFSLLFQIGRQSQFRLKRWPHAFQITFGMLILLTIDKEESN